MRLELEREKETKNTVRYRAVDEHSAIPMLYVDKREIARMGNPERLVLSLEAVLQPLRQAA
jgi:hypothetical protein